jgi:general secretion pathway protein C
MGFDGRLKRFFPAVVLAFLAVAAFFQARGIGQLVGTSLTDPSSPPPSLLPPPGARPALASNERATDGAAILGRNPFDSITGALDGKAPVGEPTPEQPTANGDPYADPICDSAKVILITAADDPAWSFAAIAGSDKKTTLRRLGDDVGGRTVYAITWDRVWLTQGSARCQLPLHDSRVAMAGDKPREGDVKPPKGESAPGRPGALPKDIADKIRQVSDTQFDVDRSVVDSIMERQGEFFRSVRIKPVKDGDRTAGLQLGGVRPGSLLGSLGMQNGDQLQSINGFEMGDPTAALTAFTRLRAADKLAVRVVRGGKPMTIDINLK